jgi:hypothetical protein
MRQGADRKRNGKAAGKPRARAQSHVLARETPIVASPGTAISCTPVIMARKPRHLR